jgi:hypothetical protein
VHQLAGEVRYDDGRPDRIGPGNRSPEVAGAQDRSLGAGEDERIRVSADVLVEGCVGARAERRVG